MTAEDKKKRGSGDLKAITALSADQTTVQSPTVPGTGADAEIELRAELNRAMGLYRLGRYQDAEADLKKLIASLERMLKRTTSAGPGPVHLSLLDASAHSVLGRARQQMGKSAEAEADYLRAVNIFSQWLPKAERPTGLEYSEFGVALYLAGLREKAVGVLEKSIEMGNICPEAYTYMAVIRLEEKRHNEAEDLLRKALALAPDDFISLKTLAQTLEARQRFDEAVNSYQEAAYILALSGRFDEALSLLNHALVIKPGDARLIARKAQILHQKGNPELALEVLDEAPGLLENHAFALAVKGKVLHALHRSAEAAEFLQRAVELDHTMAWGYVELGLALGSLGKYENALQTLNQALELAPDDPFAISVKGQVLRLLGRNTEAIGLLRRAVELDQNLWAHADLAAALNDEGKYEEALQAADRALDLNPGNIFAMAIKGDVLKNLGQLNEALQILDRALSIKPDYAPAMGIKSEVLNALGRYRESLEFLDRVLSLAPEHAWTLGIRGQTLAALGRHAEAVESLGQAIKVDPALSWAYIDLADSLIRLRKPEQALEVLDQALERRPNNVQLLRNKAMVLNQLGRYEETLEVLDPILSKESDDPLLWLTKARAQRALGKLKEGLQTIKQTLELMPNDLSLLEIKWQIQLDYELFEDAIQTLNQALDLEPRNVALLRSKGYALLRLQRDHEALETFSRALEINDNDPWTLTAAAGASQTTEEYDQAWVFVEKALELIEGRSPERPWALGTKGEILCDLGVFDTAANLFDEAIKLDPDDSKNYLFKGWALENLGREHLNAAHQAYDDGLKLRTDQIWFQKGLANTLYLLGRREEAQTHYLEAIKAIKKLQEKGKLSDSQLSLMGWCYYRLAQYDEAARSFIEALSLNPGLVSAQFDLALVLMCSRSCGLALKGYRQGLELLDNKHVLRQRALIYIARDDLREAVKMQAELQEVKEAGNALEMLNEAYEETYSVAMAQGTPSSPIPVEMFQALIPRSDPSLESISAELKAASRFLEHQSKGRDKFRARIKAVINEARITISNEELIRLADKYQWSTWAVESLPVLYIPLATLADGHVDTLVWHYVLDCVPESYQHEVKEKLCHGCVIEAILPQKTHAYLAPIARIFEQVRLSNPYPSSRAMIVAASNMMADLEEKAYDQGDSETAAACKETRQKLLERQASAPKQSQLS